MAADRIAGGWSRLRARLVVGLFAVAACGGGGGAAQSCTPPECQVVEVNTQAPFDLHEVGVARCSSGQCDLIVVGGDLSGEYRVRVIAGDVVTVDGATFEVVSVDADGVGLSRP